MSNSRAQADPAYIVKVLNYLCIPGQVVELRAISGDRRGTISGYFNDFQKMAAEAVKLSGTVPAVYFTANPVKPAMLSRAVNRVRERTKDGDTTGDQHIIKRTKFLIDCDSTPENVSGISSTDAGHKTAIKRAKEIKAWLEKDLEFPPLLHADSGNGGHLMGELDLENTPGNTELLKKCLEAIALRFEDDEIKIDQKVFNAARIWKLYGTWACKGDETEERHHRCSNVISVPKAKLTPIPIERMEYLASLAPKTPKPEFHKTDFNLEDWIAKSGLDIVLSAPWQQAGWKWIPRVCPWNSDHTNRSAYIMRLPSGAISAGCHHNGCAGKDWRDLREIVEPGWQQRRSDNSRSQTKSNNNESQREEKTKPETPPLEAGTGASSEINPGPYTVDGGCICKIHYSDKGGMTYEPLCNFDAKVAEEILLDDGAEATRAFIINGKLSDGKILPPCRIPASRFAGMSWVTESWGLRAVVNAGNTKRDSLREAIQRLSPETKTRQIFTHTGWREIGGKWVYLSGSMAGNGGYEIDLGTELSRYQLPAVPKNPVAAMRASIDLLDVAPLRITAPLWAACYRAPLVSAFPQDLSFWLEGPTGSMKSTLAGLYLSHFGDFDRIHLPGAWSSTANQLERRAFLLKDCLFVIDDYAPSALDHRELESKASRLLRSQGNISGRGRLRSDLTERPAFPPRGIIISTGEQHPPGQSLLARTLIIELAQADIGLQRLTRAQEQSAQLAQAMAGYVAWLGPQMSDMPLLLRETFRGARTKATTGGEHLRIPEAAAHLWLGLRCGLRYAEEIGALNAGQASELGENCWKAFLEIGREQAAMVENEQPIRRFLDVLYTILTQGRAVLSLKGETPPEQKPSVDFIGWRDDDFLYLLPEATFSAVVRFCRDTGEHFSTRQERLKRDLAKEGISECEERRFTTTVRIGSHIKRILKLNIEKIEKVIGVTDVTTPQRPNYPQTGDTGGDR